MIKTVIFLALIAFAPLAADVQEPEAQAPEVEAEFQESINEAWKDAVEGTSSYKACAALKGSLHGRIQYQGQDDLATRAATAIRACEVDVPVRYFETYLDGVIAGDNTCMDFMSHFQTEMGGIATRPASLEEMEPEVPKKLILEALSDRINTDCPDVAPWLLSDIGEGS
jgi:hypothetical protein